MSISDNYLKERLDDQIDYYEKRSQYNKFRYRITEIIIIVAGALIPLLNSTGSVTDLTKNPILLSQLLFASSLLGIIVTVITGFSKMEKYFEGWVITRTTVEFLRKKSFYLKTEQEDILIYQQRIELKH